MYHLTNLVPLELSSVFLYHLPLRPIGPEPWNATAPRLRSTAAYRVTRLTVLIREYQLCSVAWGSCIPRFLDRWGRGRWYKNTTGIIQCVLDCDVVHCYVANRPLIRLNYHEDANRVIARASSFVWCMLSSL